MMEKYFCNYEQALALKELGFDEPCFGWYENNELVTLLECIYPEDRLEFIKVGEISKRISAPLKSQVLQWFRDKHQLYGEVHTDCTTYPKFCYSHTKFFGNPNDLTEQEWGWENTGQYSLLYSSYTQAESELINHLISIINNTSYERK